MVETPQVVIMVIVMVMVMAILLVTVFLNEFLIVVVMVTIKVMIMLFASQLPDPGTTQLTIPFQQKKNQIKDT